MKGKTPGPLFHPPAGTPPPAPVPEFPWWDIEAGAYTPPLFCSN